MVTSQGTIEIPVAQGTDHGTRTQGQITQTQYSVGVANLLRGNDFSLMLVPVSSEEKSKTKFFLGHPGHPSYEMLYIMPQKKNILFPET